MAGARGYISKFQL